MNKKNILFFIFLVIFTSIHAQEVRFSTNTAEKSLFTDFRIPVRKNISESDLIYDGWKTDSAMYAFRCSDGIRIRMTLWYLTEEDSDIKISEFVNITRAMGNCKEEDLEYTIPSTKKTTQP